MTMAPAPGGDDTKTSANANVNANTKATTKAKTRMKKTTANTVFFRYSPSESSITHKNFETFFSDVGPVKKCSIIRSDNKTNEGSDNNGNNTNTNNTREAKGYGFCKFTCQEDAIEAANKLNNRQMNLEYGLQVKVWVELADAQNSSNNNDQKKKRIAASSTSAASPASSSSALSSKLQQAPLPEGAPSSDEKGMSTEDLFQLQAKKRTSRIIIRNLSFYATENNIRHVMQEKFGEVVEINLPLVPVKAEDDTSTNTNTDKNKKRKKQKQQQQHRGFAFVTFANQKSAHKAVEACASPDGQVLIKKRPVAIDFSVSKFHHRRMKEQQENREEEEGEDLGNDGDNDNDNEKESSEKDGDDTNDENSSSGSDSDSDSDSSDSSDDDSTTSSSDSDGDNEMDEQKPKVQNSHSNSLFLRNLPFDATRHDIFTLFAKFGRISGIYLVKDSDTGMAKGTAFVKFEKEGGCLRALEAGSTNGSGASDTNINDFQSEKNMMTSLIGGSGGLFLNGRRIFVDKAVDRNTAESLKVQRDEDGKPIDKKIGKDKRNLYLKGEGRVREGEKDSSDPNSWENIPQTDQVKRGRAHQEKHTKLRSPLFFINPFRLSLRNLGKHVNESQLKALVATGIQKGLEKNLVSKEDVISHWRAGGELTAREIIQKLNASDGDEDIIPSYDESEGIKKYVPSVFIDRDFQSKEGKTSKILAPSRGFGFAEFTHHAHALACLRELNNNTAYSAEFVAGGKKASLMKKNALSRKRKKGKQQTDVDEEFLGEDGKVRVPRLIVEFTVENKAKARKQAERKAQQLANAQKQKAAVKQLSDEKSEKKKKKKSRGALQREKKRKMKEEGSSEKDQILDEKVVTKKPKITEEDSTSSSGDKEKSTKKKGIKPPKKQKLDKDESAFQDMIRSYKKAFAGGSQTKEEKSVRSEITKKRWFE